MNREPNPNRDSKEHTERIEQLFFEAIDQKEIDPAQFVKSVTEHDPMLRSEVLALLELHAREDADQYILDQPIHQKNLAISTTSLETKTGDRIGKYLLERRIGEGGMGVVYEARQVMEVNRTVAVKVLKLGFHSEQTKRRFELERQVLAILDHKGITKILDAGTTELGQPYFVMDFVKGIDVCQFARNQNLSLHERLRVFVEICQAVHYAHQKGVIHRDLKPTNILVSSNDGRSSPKVIDFGIAKLFDHNSVDSNFSTEQRLLLGTPQYMSPEQACGDYSKVDTRSDIFSLGMILYELITGSTPLSTSQIKNLSPLEIVESIHSCVCQPPSKNLKKSAIDSSSFDRPNWVIEKDLDHIVMKSIEKDPNLRYPSVEAFGSDIQRFLNGDPVQAVPPSRSYRWKRFYFKHQKLANIGVLVVAGFLLLFAVTVTLAIQSTRANQKNVELVGSLKKSLKLLENKNNELYLAEKKIRLANHNQKYFSAIAVSFTELNERLNKGLSFSKSSNRNKYAIQKRYRNHLIKFRHKNLVQSAVHRLEKVSELISSSNDFGEDTTQSRTELTGHLETQISDLASSHRLPFAKLLVKNTRQVFGSNQIEVADAMNLLAATQIECGKFQEAKDTLERVKKMEIPIVSRTTDSRKKLEELLAGLREKTRSNLQEPAKPSSFDK